MAGITLSCTDRTSFHPTILPPHPSTTNGPNYAQHVSKRSREPRRSSRETGARPEGGPPSYEPKTALDTPFCNYPRLQIGLSPEDILATM